MPAGANRIVTPPLGRQQIDVWSFALTAARGARRAQAGTIRRAILASYLELEPEQLRLDRTPTGKPVLADGSLQFNLTHSGQLAMLAVTREFPVGIDLEHLRRPAPNRRGLNLEQALRDRCTAAEAKSVRNAADPLDAFTRLWVRKEAVVKASGDGVLDQLAEIDVSGERVLATAGALTGLWSCLDLPAAADFHAALAFPAQFEPLIRDFSLGSDPRP